MNQTIKTQLEHRSIREFVQKPVSKEVIQQLLEVANHTATSTAMQSYSIIRVTDVELRKEIGKVCAQDYVNRCPEFWIFIVDCYRNAKIAEEQGYTFESAYDPDRFFQGFTDGALAAQNVTNAVESLGMGAVYFGSILNNVKKIIELLKLPKGTFPIVGIGFGEPDQDPMLKPRMSLEMKVFENTYEVFESYTQKLKEYDEEMNHYYDLRDKGKRMDTFTKQVITRLSNPNPLRQQLIQLMKDQGFTLMVDQEV